MKNLIWILAAIMLAGCGDNEEGQDMGLHGDPPGYSLFIWSNESDHRITMTVTEKACCRRRSVSLPLRALKDI